MTESPSPGPSIEAFAELDHDRTARRGYPEAIYCEGKTPEQVAMIAAAVRDQPHVTLFTRASKQHAAAIPEAFHDQEAGLLAWPPSPPSTTGGLVVVLAAGTSDLPVAKEAQLTACYLGRSTELVVDVGVAGLHRILGRLELLRRALVVVVAAGWMAPSQRRCGLIEAPVVVAHLSGLRRRVRRIGRSVGHAQRVRARRSGGEHRQRLRRRSPGGPDRVGMSSRRHAWIDASAGVAGDMLLGALIDAGADLAVVQQAVDAVIADSVRLTATPVTRAGQHANRISVEAIVQDVPTREWKAIEDLIATARVPSPVRDRALATFGRLADAEGRVHHTPPERVHFHEVGALDSIADVVGVAAALHALEIDSISASAVAVGSGRVQGAHGDLGVPVPAVVELATGWKIFAGGSGELTTPTGMALVSRWLRTAKTCRRSPCRLRGRRRQPRYTRTAECDTGPHRSTSHAARR